MASALFSPTIYSSKSLFLHSYSFPSRVSSSSLNTLFHSQNKVNHFSKRRRVKNFPTFCTDYEVGGGYPDSDFHAVQERPSSQIHDQINQKLDASQYEAILKGGEQVTSVLEEMISLRKSLLEVIKETVLSHLTRKCPPHVQVVGLLCRTPQKESRHELLRRVAAGGGEFKSQNGTKVHLPGANLNDIANQADDLLETMESRPVVPDRKLLARLVLIREEARNMMGGGILDERNDRGLNVLPESEVNFLTKLVALKPGKTVQEMIKNVMLGKDEGADNSSDYVENGAGGIAGRGSVTGCKPLPVRPGMFLETVSKVLGGIYAGNVPGITAQHLEWVHQKTLQVLQEIAF
ncbi:Protein PEP-RELATED DEVELOPMENT ARRESTED 1, chloroplastic [Ancistrocladus abbreviatus]